MATPEEIKLVAEVQSGSREAFERLLDIYEDNVFNLVTRMVGSQEAEDVAQEALVQIYNSIGGFKGKSSLSTWVYRVVVNVCLQHRRKRRPEVVGVDDYVVEPASGDVDELHAAAVSSETRQRIDAALADLPEIHRDVVVLHEIHGLTYQECAEVLKCPVGTVKSRLSNAFAKLRELLRDYASESGVAI